MVDVGDPARPVETGFYDTPGEAHRVAVAGKYAYVADDSSLMIFDCSAALSVAEHWPAGSDRSLRGAL